MKPTKYYAVKVGKKTGIFYTWNECKENVYQYPNSEYKSFATLEEAKAYLNNETITTISSDIVCYVDGSYNNETKEYSFGAIIIKPDGTIDSFKKRFPPDEYSESRNVAGEIRGASFVIYECAKRGYKEIDLIYDYKGIKEFYTGDWSTNKKLTGLYSDFGKEYKDKIKVNFIKVKSHSNNKYNDMVDMLAKDALGIK